MQSKPIKMPGPSRLRTRALLLWGHAPRVRRPAIWRRTFATVTDSIRYAPPLTLPARTPPPVQTDTPNP